MQATIMGRNVLRTALALVCLAVGTGCEELAQDDFKSEGGMAPDPTAVLAGSVVYVGPPPACDFERGKATRVRGRVILTLFAYDNPPPPEGRATTAENLMAISADELFETTDCLPEGGVVDPTATIMRSVSFSWPQVALKPQARDLQIRGFYDYDEDMSPFFSVTSLATAGDVIGGALANLKQPGEGMLRITVPSVERASKGFLRDDLTVVLSDYVWMERPAFKLAADARQLSAEQPLPLVIGIDAKTGQLGPDTARTLESIWALSCDTPGEPDCGFAIESLSLDEDGPKLAAAGVELDFSPERYAYAVQSVDVKTVVVDGPDLMVPDGVPDPHPLLGASLPIPYLLPLVLMQRRAQSSAQALIEAAAGIPRVTLIGSPLLSEIEVKKTFVARMNAAITPIAVVDLDPNNSACTVPYAPPGNSASTYESRVTICDELPTGLYGVNVLAGTAGGERREVSANESDNGLSIVGGKLSGQAWSLPNTLADESQVGKGNVLEHQGDSALFVVHDPHPEERGDCTQARDNVTFNLRDVTYRGVCESDQIPLTESLGLFGAARGVDGIECLPQACCDGIAHLCDVPLCAVTEVRGLSVRASPTRSTRRDDGRIIPDCVPFAIPSLCCPTASGE